MVSRREGTLPRRGVLGVTFQRGAAPGEGVPIASVVEAMPAAQAGLAPGDVILRVDGHEVASPSAVRGRLAGVLEGATVVLSLRTRDGVLREESLVAIARPLERHAGCDVVYGDVSCGAARLRTIVVLPAGDRAGEPLPWVLHVQGHGAASIDGGGASDRPLSSLAGVLGRAGIASVRFDRSGSGDSLGPRLDQLSLAEEHDQVAAAFDHARALPELASDEGFLFAHSLGGVIAGDLAASAARRPRGMIVYGGGAKTWTEYFDENCRRQWSLAGVPLAAQDRSLRALQRFHARLLGERLPLPEVLERMPEIADDPGLYAVESRWVVRGRPFTYWQDVHDAPVAQRLASAGVPVLAAWGASDWLSSREDHELVAACASEGGAGLGTFAEVPGADHFFAARATAAASYAATSGGRLSPRLARLLVSWVRAKLQAR
jgi:pimeloyl-ACP methyl ester carboxylesterase